MRASRCTACGRVAFPRHRVCPACRGEAFEEVELGEGTLLTHTVLHVPPPGVEPPLRLGIVAFEGGVRALGQLLAPADVGARVRAEVGPTRRREGEVVTGVRFRPLDEGKG